MVEHSILLHLRVLLGTSHEFDAPNGTFRFEDSKSIAETKAIHIGRCWRLVRIGKNQAARNYGNGITVFCGLVDGVDAPDGMATSQE